MLPVKLNLLELAHVLSVLASLLKKSLLPQPLVLHLLFKPLLEHLAFGNELLSILLILGVGYLCAELVPLSLGLRLKVFFELLLIELMGVLDVLFHSV